jgi:hypothetical protein
LNDSFNSNFYIMTSTVIPVLYIALIVQLPIIGRIIRSASDNLDERLKGIQSNKNPFRMPVNLIVVLGSYLIALIVCILIIGASILGEIQSILALYYRSDDPTTRHSTLGCVISLLILAVLLPSFTVIVEIMRVTIWVQISPEKRERILKWWRKKLEEIPSTESESSTEDEES